MKNLLKKIIKDKKDQEITTLNAVEIVNSLFSELQERERDVLSRRFALGRVDHQTLEEIGKLHNLTRERVRQIERASLLKLKKVKDLEKNLADMRKLATTLMEEHGGVMEQDFLLDILAVMMYRTKDDNFSYDRAVYKNYLDFVLSELLDDTIEKVSKSDKFTSFFKLKNRTIDYLEDLVRELKAKVGEIKKTLKFEDLVGVLKGLKSFPRFQDKALKNIDEDLDLKDIYRDETFPEWADIIDRYKPYYSFMQAVKDINPNKLGYWGSVDWSEIKPRRISDKIYLILKEENKPLHFSEIAKKINETNFDSKKVNVGSVHNELILDDRYVLVKRGIYGLREGVK